MDNYFKSALIDFASDVAAGDAIRHLAQKGMTIREISENLTYPAPIDTIKEVVWKFFLSNGTILLNKPKNNSGKITQTEYITERDRFGHLSFRRVETAVSDTLHEYVECDFGKKLYKDRDEFIKSLECLDRNDREYILDLPWPLEPVYHIKNERMMRIEEKLLYKI